MEGSEPSTLPESLNVAKLYGPAVSDQMLPASLTDWIHFVLSWIPPDILLAFGKDAEIYKHTPIPPVNEPTRPDLFASLSV